jgi:hypothetical protein
MIPISFWWNGRKRSASLKLDGFVSSEWESGKWKTKVLRIPLPLSLMKEKTGFSGLPPFRWLYLKGIFSFLTEWKMKRVEGTLSFQNPMVNGMLYAWMSAARSVLDKDGKVEVTVNFLGENRLEGEFTISLKTLVHHFGSWIYPLIREMRGKRAVKGGG